jgi:hypothetical protein
MSCSAISPDASALSLGDNLEYADHMTARDDVLAAAQALAARSEDGTFSLSNVISEMRRRRSVYEESIIRTHVTSKMCSNAPDQQGTAYNDLTQVARGRYRLTS